MRRTDSTGRITLDLPSGVADRMAVLDVEAAGFAPKKEEVRLVAGYTPRDVQLAPVQLALVVQPSPASSSGAGVPGKTVAATSPSDTGASAQGETPASSAVTPAAHGEVTRVYASGPRLSGSGGAFSDEHILCANDLPSNARIASVDFALSGDRRCNAWATCREQSRTQNSVCYAFAMQGHNEWPAPGQAQSEGLLTVKYLLQ